MEIFHEVEGISSEDKEGKTAERIAMTPVDNHEAQEVDTETGSKEIESEEV